MSRALLVFGSLTILTFGCEAKEGAAPTTEPVAASAPPAAAPATAAAPTPPPSTAAESGEPTFEGEVDLSMETKSPKSATMKATMVLKDGKMRMNVDDRSAKGGVSQIIDPKNSQMVSLAHGPKIAMDMSMSGILGSLAPWMPRDTGGDPGHPEMKKTDRTATIVGHECQYWDYELKDGERGSVCLAKLGVGWVTLGSVENAKWAETAFEGRRFPLRYVNYDASGKESATMEVTRLEKKSVPDSAFEVPADYKRMDASRMMEGLMPTMMAGAKAERPTTMKMPKDMAEMLEKMKRGQAK